LIIYNIRESFNRTKMPVKTECVDNGWDDFADQPLEVALWKDLSVSCYDCAPAEYYASAQDCEIFDCNDLMSQPPKSQIRNHDCMWSGRCVDKSHPGKLLDTTVGVALQNVDNKIKEEVDTSTSNQNVSKPSLAGNIQLNTQKVKLQQIQPGRSLLINSRWNQNNNNNHSSKNLNMKSAVTNQQQQHQQTMSELLKYENNTLLTPTTGSTTRPDTPLSLDDDSPEFKHNFDLATCTSGSNNLSLVTPDDAKYINMLKEHLELSVQEAICAKQQNDLKQLTMPTMPLNLQNTNVDSETLTDLLSYLKYLPDYSELEGDSAVEMDSSDSEGSSSNGGRSINSGSSSTSSGVMSSQSSMYDYHQQATHVGDHSYTLPKKFYDTNSLGVQTPSDSGECFRISKFELRGHLKNPKTHEMYALFLAKVMALPAMCFEAVSTNPKFKNIRKSVERTDGSVQGFIRAAICMFEAKI
jgi:hypothetical protein